MGDHSKLPRSPTWPRFEIIFNEISKTPQTGNAPPSTPGAPRKPSQQVQRAASGLKPRKLTYGFEDLRSREEEDDEIMISEWVEEMSGHAITSTPLTSRSSFSMDIVTDDDDDDNKENRPESADATEVDTSLDERQPESLRSRLNNWVHSHLHNYLQKLNI